MGLLSFGRDRTSSSSQSSSASVASSRTQQEVFLADMFSSLFAGAAGEAAGIDTGALTRTANQLFQSGAGFVDELDAAGQPGFISNVSPGGVAPISVGSNVADEIAELQSDLGSLFTEELQPAIRSNAIMGRSLGGGREGVATNDALGEVAKAFAGGAVDIRSRDLDRRLQADLANQQTALAELGLNLGADQFNVTAGLDSRGLDIEAATRGLSALPGLAGLAEFGAGAGLSPYLALAQIYGDPTVLTEAESSSESESSSSSRLSSRRLNFGTSFS